MADYSSHYLSYYDIYSSIESGKKATDVFDYVKDNLNFDQLIWEFGTKDAPDWVHVSYESTGKQRKQILRAVKSGGKTTYQPYV